MSRKNYSDEDMQSALSNIRAGLSIHKASKEFKIPRGTLQNRKHNRTKKLTKDNGQNTESQSIDYNQFREIVGARKIQQLENFDESYTCTEDFTLLLKIHRNLTNIMSQPHQDTDANNFIQTSNDIRFEIDDFDCPDFILEELSDQVAENITTHTGFASSDSKSSPNPQNLEGIVEEATKTLVLNIPEPRPPLNLEYTEDGIYPDQSFNINNMDIIFLDQPGVEINNYLITPKTPVRIGKRNSERQTFIISSTPYRASEELKAEKKKLSESLKEERQIVRLQNKRKREEKATIAAKRKLTKQQARVEKKQSVSNPKLSSEGKVTKNQSTNIFKNMTNFLKAPCDKIIPKTVGITTTPSTEHNTKTHNLPIKCNMKKTVELVNESHIRKLLFSENEPVNEIRGYDKEQVFSGLCFECGGQISTQKQGINCTACANSYHQDCIPKTVFNENQTKCPKCHSTP